ncbi:MAG: protein-(glutamine-N5) methyltransferase, release factor-specific [Nitrospira sp.]|nr:MAG: protein-(glutamine-N5) methyltransferase, release factor-specific [Nitrospira sp.]
MAESKTIGTLIAWAQQSLDQAGTGNAAQETLWLLANALGLESHHLASKAEQPVSAEVWARVGSLVSRRVAREPLQYILGTQEFCGLEFHVSPAVLIPRPETELLVQEVVRGGGLNKDAVLVDVGTGSGCVAITLATILNRTRILAMDHSPEALAVAKNNAQRHAVDDKIDWMEGDLLSPLREREMAGAVDVIVSNPPYIAEVDWADLQPEVRLFEPRLALIGGQKGTEFHERLLQDSREFLVPGGLLVMEIGQGQASALRRTAEQVGGYAALQVVEDAAGIERVVIAQRLG